MSSAEPYALNRSREFAALTQSGYVMLLVSLALVGVAVWLFIGAVTPDEPDGLKVIGAIITGFIVYGGIRRIAKVLLLIGHIGTQPGPHLVTACHIC